MRWFIEYVNDNGIIGVCLEVGVGLFCIISLVKCALT